VVLEEFTIVYVPCTRAKRWLIFIEKDIIQLTLLWCSGTAQRGGGQSARAVCGRWTATIHVYLRMYIRRIRSEVELGQGCQKRELWERSVLLTTVRRM
jgi:hypothetical protein